MDILTFIFQFLILKIYLLIDTFFLLVIDDHFTVSFEFRRSSRKLTSHPNKPLFFLGIVRFLLVHW